MLPEKAKEIIKNKMAERRKGMHFDSCKMESALTCALQCIERQIPLKPSNVDANEGWFECGNCHGLIYNSSDRMSDHKYCLLCGQKIRRITTLVINEHCESEHCSK